MRMWGSYTFQVMGSCHELIVKFPDCAFIFVCFMCRRRGEYKKFLCIIPFKLRPLAQYKLFNLTLPVLSHY